MGKCDVKCNNKCVNTYKPSVVPSTNLFRLAQLVSTEITTDTTFTSDRIWIITNEIHVRVGATLTIEPGTIVQFSPNEIPIGVRNGDLPYPTLVIDSGASINAQNTVFESSSENSTGGLIIAGTLANGVFEGYASVVSDTTATPRISYLNNVTFRNLGQNTSDINAVTLFNAFGGEVIMGTMSILNAGDDGLEIFGGSHVINSLTIINAIDDLLDLDFNSNLTITNRLELSQLPIRTTGLIEVVGDVGTTNTVIVNQNASLILNGPVLSDKVVGTYQSGGSFPAPASANLPISLNTTALPNTFWRGIL